MTENQLKYLNFMVTAQIRLLKTIKTMKFNNSWTDEFNRLAIETMEALIYQFESFFLQPKENLKSLTRVFTQKNEIIRKEIRIEVKKRFYNFKRREL